ncbi:MAG: phage tail tape measure protein, partial [Proteobacteria bacterium]|nr:phage tail tape measure protein [Pseudomonadota bacterium]
MDASFGIGMLFRAKDMASGVVGGLEGRMKSLGAASDRASRRFAKSIDRMRAGLKLMAAGGAVIGGMGLLVRSTVASQQALGEMGSLGYKNFAVLDKAATRFTNKWAGYSKAQFITAAYDIKSGIESLSDAGVAEYTRMAVLTAKATKASAGEMTKLFALIYGVYKSSYKNMSDLDFGRMVSGGISAAVKVFRTDGRDLVQGISSIGRAAQGMGVKFHEQLAILGVAKGAFGTAAEAGTGYRAFLTTVLKAQKALGMSFTDSQGRLLPFVGILKKIEAKFGDLSKAKAQMALQKAFGSAEAVKFIMAFAGKTKYLTAKLSELKGAMKGGTAVTVEMARAMNMRIGDVLKLFGQRMHNLFESIGKTLLPVVIPIVNAIGKVITAVQRFASENPRLVGTITRIVFAIGGLVFALGAGAVAWHFFGRYARIAMSSIAKTFLPVTLALAAIAGLVYLFRKAWKSNFGGIATKLTNFWNKVKLVWEGVTTLIGSFTGKAGT